MDERDYTSSDKSETKSLFHRVYGWMTLGLILTSVTAYYVAASPTIYTFLFSNPFVLMGIFIAQLSLVVVLSMFLLRISFFTAAVLFLVYALSLGFTLSSIFLVMTKISIFTAFVTTAGMFAAMSIYGYFTDADLSTMGNYLFMGLIGLIIAMVVNIFFVSSWLHFLISIAGVFLFTILTAYDTQRIKQMARQQTDTRDMNKIAIYGALALYLDFINLFLFTLQLMGGKKR